MSGERVLFVVDAGPTIGGGHVMRSLTLAGGLAARGATCAFVSPPQVAQILDAFAPQTAQLAAASSAGRDLASAIGEERFDAIVFDHYGLDERAHREMAKGRPVLVIDDLADRPLGADVLLDSGPMRRAEDYDGLIPETARFLRGPEYAPVRPEFAALRETALAWRGEPVGRVLVSLGLTDLDGITGRVVERIRPRVNDTGIDIVLGWRRLSLASLSRAWPAATSAWRCTWTPRTWPSSPPRRTSRSARRGSSVWERCTLGLPSVMVVLAENQRPAAQAARRAARR